MMDGVTILATETCYMTTAGLGFAPIFFLVLMFVVIGVSISMAIINSDSSYLVFMLIALFPLLLYIMTYDFSGPEVEYQKYKVTIDDSVNFNEFISRYEIVSQDGLIYEITEKGVDSN